jgi:hypothetical protein
MAGLLAVSVSAGSGEDSVAYSQLLADMNVALANAGSNYRIESAEILRQSDSWEGATTIVANNRTHQIGSLFVERDPRRGGFADISYLVDQSDGSALAFGNPGEPLVVLLPNSATEPVLDASMLRWQNEPHCPGPQVVKIADDGVDPDIVDALVLEDPALFGRPFSADIVHGGWLPPGFFDLLAPGGGGGILGVTFTLNFVDEDGNLTDIDNNGRADTAFREIYYNLAFGWREGPSRQRGIDLDSVATHEAGHAFGLGHFGKVFVDNNDVLKFAPRAVMNAVYVSPFASLTGTDNASFCSIWANGK